MILKWQQVADTACRYVKKSHLEQILLRPDTYIGSVEKLTQSMCVYDEGLGFRTREITYVPGLFKIFDEILGSGRLSLDSTH